MSSNTETSLTLLQGLQSGSNDAWDRFVTRYRPRIMAKFMRFGLQLEDADSFTQEILIELFQKISGFKRERTGSLRNWMSTIIKYRLIDFFRQKKHKPKFETLNDNHTSKNRCQTPESTSVSETVMKMIQLIRSEFSDRDWKIFFLYVGEDVPPEIIAKELKITPNMVYLVKSRMMHRIAKIVHELKKN
jgi:RNA polymerase sigma factor (sigma-70 family)